jgi:hypothetical protein
VLDVLYEKGLIAEPDNCEIRAKELRVELMEFARCVGVVLHREDYLTSQSFRTAEERDNYWAELKTAAETGWDFSSRWFILDGTNKGTR